MRTRGQEYWDRFVLLDLFGAVSAVDVVGGNLKAQKLTFLLELDALRDSSAIGHYRFFGYQMGPYSADLAEPNLREIQPLSDDLIEDIGLELAIKPERLHPDNSSYRQTVRQALQRASA